MNRKMFLGKARYLPRMYVVIVLCSIIWLGGSGKGGGKSPSQPSCSNRPTKSFVTLSFPSSVPGNLCGSVPPLGSNPFVNTGANSVYDTSKYYLEIIVRGTCENFERTYIWTKPSANIEIEHPTGSSYSIIADYYSACDNSGCFTTPRSRLRLASKRDYAGVDVPSVISFEYLRYSPCN